MQFDDLGIDSRLVEALKNNKITEPSPIQCEAIPAIARGESLIIESATGSGKTYAYLLPLVSALDCESNAVQLLITASTHELVMQIYSVTKQLSQDSGIPFRVASAIGKVHIQRQVEKLKERPHIVVGTPGRITDLMKIKKLKVHQVATYVIDEADSQLLSESRLPLTVISQSMMRDTQRLFVSAKFSTKAKDRAAEMANGLSVVTAGLSLPTNIEHLYVETEDHRDKMKLLRKVLAITSQGRTLLFVKKNSDVRIIAEKLAYHNYTVCQLSGEMEKKERKDNLFLFEKTKNGILIASPVAAHGLDIALVDTIVHYDIPLNSSDYMHRSGRTGRAGKAGVSLSITDLQEAKRLRRISGELGVVLSKKNISEGKLV
ncbi:MAG: DEAD/DEAH box helicase [Spirochaetes bacterium]|nr:DEAD/DEAH box helicase [Spirochaetota bacterium]